MCCSSISILNFDGDEAMRIDTLTLLLAGLLTVSTAAWPAPREASKNDAALMKLQAALKAVTAERDAAKGELGNLSSEVERLRKDKDSAIAAKDELGSSLAAQKNSSQALQGRLSQTEAKLSDSAEKARELGQAKASLSQELAALKAQQQVTAQQLQICGDHNGKLVKSAQELLEHYQGKGTIATLLQDEPLLGFQSVEMEGIADQYRDQIDAGKFKAVD
jgi:chromosome segregation ATPase